MILSAPAALACPLCGQALDPAIARLNQQLELRTVRLLQTLHPGWSLTEGICPDCVQQAVNIVRERRSAASLHASLELSYPVYAADEADLLPTPVRLNANPDYSGRGVTVAFLDSGFYPHSDLTTPRDRIRAYVDATVSEPVAKARFRRAEVTSWHGLMTSGVAAGNGSKSGGLYRGLAAEAELVLVKTGNRRTHRIPDRDILRALQWVVVQRAEFDIRVLNISLGGDFASTGEATPLDMLVEEAVAEGLVVVAAAGNGGHNRVIPPASAHSAITVGGLDDQNSLDPRFHRMWQSSFGRGVGGVAKPDVIAPAIWVAAPTLPHTWVHNEAVFLWRLLELSDHELTRFLTTDLAEARFRKETLRQPLHEVRGVIRRRITERKYISPHYQHVDGTSMAAPIVTSLAAQMVEANPRLTPAGIKDIITNTAEPLAYVPRAEQGHGVINATRAVAGALRAASGPLRGLPVSPRITRQGITLIIQAPGALSVSLVADFNAWRPEAGRMREIRAGVWEIVVPPPAAGAHTYKFLVDGTWWKHDVENPARIEDGCGGYYSRMDIS
jgi:serine protease AprX